jgi:hypothetical protein
MGADVLKIGYDDSPFGEISRARRQIWEPRASTRNGA